MNIKVVEGNFITKEQRNEHSKDVKRTHFYIGNYQHSEKFEKLMHESPKVGEFVDMKKLMRLSHFELGKDKQVTETETKSRYKSIEHTETRNQKTPTSVVDIRKHNYKLGNHIEKMTTSSQVINGVQGDTAKILINSNFSKAHHFVYGTDKPTSTTSSKIDFTLKQNSKTQAKEAENLKKDLQKSHFEFGKSDPCYQTTSQSEFKSVTTKTDLRKVDLMQEHYKLGTDRSDYSTTSQQFFKGLNKSTEKFETERPKDLRKTHFVIGNSKSDYKLTSHELNNNTSEKSLENSQHTNAESLRRTNFILGSENKPNKTMYASIYSASTSKNSDGNFVRPSDKTSSILLGNEKSEKVSVNHHDFQKFSILPLNSQQNGELIRSHHYQFGSEKNNFKSSYQNYGDFKGQAPEKSEKVDLNLNSTHFVLGNAQREMISSNRTDFKGIRSNTSEAIKTIEKKTEIGKNEKRYWDTEQKHRFNWIKPLPDYEFKFSFH